MAWKQRGNKRYLYQTVREGQQFRSVYWGRGVAAHLAIRQIRKQQKHWQAERAKIKALEITLTTLQKWEPYAKLLTRATLLLAGFYRHHGSEWRFRSVP